MREVDLSIDMLPAGAEVRVPYGTGRRCMAAMVLYQCRLASDKGGAAYVVEHRSGARRIYGAGQLCLPAEAEELA